MDFIDIAYFVGSDYTEGIEGIGVVTALEIVNHFKKISLTNGNKDDPAVLFAEWWKKFQQTKDLKDEAHKDLAKKLVSFLFFFIIILLFFLLLIKFKST